MVPDRLIKRLADLSALMTFILCGIFLLMAILPENSWWGINHLYFLPPAAQIVFTVLIVLVLLPHTRRLMVPPGRRLKALPRYVQAGGFIVIGLTLFIAFRVAVHSLGDGYQRAYQIEFGKIFYAPEMLDFAVHALLYRALNLVISVDAATVIAATSVAAGGIYVLLLYRTFLSDNRYGRLIFTAVISLGCSQFFFGYVESYTLALLFSVWFVLLAFAVHDGRPGILKLSAVYLLAGLSHQGALLLAPAYIYLIFNVSRKPLRRCAASVAGIIVACLPYVVPVVISMAIGKENLRNPLEYFLPFVGKAGEIFSAAHLHGLVNEFLLVAPVAIMLLPLIVPAAKDNKYRRLLLTLCVPAGLFVILFNPELSIPRDWDLLAVPVVIIVIPLLLSLFKKMNEWPAIARSRTITAISISIFFLAAWVAVNASTESNLERAEYLLKQSPTAQRYGYEQLAFYYSRKGDHENELRMLMAIKPEDRTSRVNGKMSQSMYTLGRYDEAYEFAMKAVADSVPSRLGAFMAGLIAYSSGEYHRSISYLRYAVSRNPRNYDWICKLGDALMKVDSVDASVEAYARAMSLDPSQFRAYIGLGEAYFRKNDYRQSWVYCTEGLRRNPQSSRGQSLRDTLRIVTGSGEKAKDVDEY